MVRRKTTSRVSLKISRSCWNFVLTWDISRYIASEIIETTYDTVPGWVFLTVLAKIWGLVRSKHIFLGFIVRSGRPIGIFPMAVNILPMHKKVNLWIVSPHFTLIGQKLYKTGPFVEKSCRVIIDVFLKSAHSDTVCYDYGSVKFLGRNYTCVKHTCVFKPSKIIQKTKKSCPVKFLKKICYSDFCLKWPNFEYLGSCAFFHDV